MCPSDSGNDTDHAAAGAEKDALDVVVTHQRSELERLQHRADRADTQAAVTITGGIAVASVAATGLAALHRGLSAPSIALTALGGVLIAASIVVSLIGRDARGSS